MQTQKNAQSVITVEKTGAVITRDFLVEKLANMNAAAKMRDDYEYAVEPSAAYKHWTAELTNIAAWFEAHNIPLNYSVTLGYWIADDVLEQFETQERCDAKQAIERLNEATSKQARARSDEKRAEYSDVINTNLTWLQQHSVEYSQTGGYYSLTPTEYQKRLRREDAREWYVEDVKRNIDRRRREFADRLDWEIRNLQGIQQRVSAGEWDSLWSSELRGSNREDMIRAFEEQKTLGDALSKLA